MQYRRYLVKNTKTGAMRTVLVPLNGKSNILEYLNKDEKTVSVVGKVDKNV